MLQTEAPSSKAAPVSKPKMAAHEIDQLIGQFNNLLALRDRRLRRTRSSCYDTLMSRPNRQARPTPQGESKRALESTEACLSELEAVSMTKDRETFVRRLNEFLVNARKVSEFLPKERGRAVGLKSVFSEAHRPCPSRSIHLCAGIN